MTLLASIESLFETYDCPYFKKPPTMIETILIPQQLSQWVHQIYFQQKKLNQLAVVKLVQHPLDSVKPNIACSIMYSIIKEKVQQVCQHIRSLLSLSYKKLKSQKQTNCDLKHQTNSWNMNFKRFRKQNHDSSERKIWGPIGHLICAYHNYLLDANKEVYDLWKLLYQCSQVKDLQFKTLQNSLNQTILEELMKQFPSQMNPRQIMPTLSSFQKHDFIFKQMWGFQKRKIIVQFHSKPELSNQEKKPEKLNQIFNSVPKKVQKGQALQPEKPIALPKSEIGINTSIKSVSKFQNQAKLTEKQATKKKAIQQELKFLQIQEQIQQLDSTAKLKILQKILTTMKDTNENKDPLSNLSSNLLNTLSPSQLQFLGRTINENQIKQNEELDKYCQNVQQSSSSSSSSEEEVLIFGKYEGSELILQKVQKIKQSEKKKTTNNQLTTNETQSVKNGNNLVQNSLKSPYIDYFQKSDLEMERRLSEPGRDIQDQKNQFINYLKFKLGTTIYQDKDGKVNVQTMDPNKMHPIFDQLCQMQANQRFGIIQSQKKKMSNVSHINAIQDKIKQEKKQIKVAQKTVVNKSKPIEKKEKPSKIHHADDSKYQENLPVGQDKQHHKMQDVADKLYELAKQRKKLIQQNAQLSESKGNLSKTLLQYLKQKHQNTKDCTVQYEQSFKCYLDNHPCTVTSKKMKIDASKLPFQWAKQLDGDGTSGFYQKSKNKLMDEFKFQTSDRLQKIIDEPDDFQTDKQTKKKKKNKKKNKKKKNLDKNTEQSTQLNEQDIIQQNKQKKQMINRCEIEQILQEQQEIQKQREQQLLMEKKIAQYQCKNQSKTNQEKDKKNIDKKSKNLEEFSQSELSLFTFLQSLQIKDQARQKCVVTQDNLKNFCKKTNFILNKKIGLIKSLSQRQSIKEPEASSYKISSYNDFSNLQRKNNQSKLKMQQEKTKEKEKSLGDKKVQSKVKPNPKKKAKR